MTRDQRAEAVARATAPALWAFAYPMTGRGWPVARRAALSLWAWLFRLRWWAQERR
jgi:hypothetical protein